MTTNTARGVSAASASGKIILTGEYAVLFGYPGIAVPTALRINVYFTPGTETAIDWPEVQNNQPWLQYTKEILEKCGHAVGTLRIENELPLGKGTGSSTALIIAICRSLLGPDCYDRALAIEDELNSGHSGIDFGVIWRETPMKFTKKDGVTPVTLPTDVIKGTFFVDTGAPKETTMELVAAIRADADKFENIFATIGHCSERLLAGEDMNAIVRDHHRAQVALGVVPVEVQRVIEKIEQAGGAAKVIGAGGKTRGAGIVLVLGVPENVLKDFKLPIITTL